MQENKYLKSAREAFIKFHRNKSYLSFQYGLYSYSRYFKYHIRRKDIALFNLMIRYSVHDYVSANKIFLSLQNRNFDQGFLNLINMYFGNSLERNSAKESIKQEKKTYKTKNILFVFGSSCDNIIEEWQNNLFNLCLESGIKDLYPEVNDDFLIGSIITHNVIRMDTRNYKDEEAFLISVPKDADLVILLAHGDKKDEPGIDVVFGNSFKNNNLKKLNLSNFCNGIYDNTRKENSKLLCFTCGSFKVQNLKFKDRVLCNYKLTFKPIISYSFSFLSSFMFDEAFDQMHTRAKLVTQICSNDFDQIED